MIEGRVSESTLPGVHFAQRVVTNPRLLFALFLVIGATAIAIGRAFPLLHIPLAIVLPVVCILGYAAINWKANYINSSRGQTGDNCYFLGFLFFLVSLSATLIFLQTGHISVEEVVRGFGTALISTIVGLGTRIVLLQGGASLSDSRETAELELTQAVQRFRDQVISNTDLLNAAQKASAESLARAAEASSSAITEGAVATKNALMSGVGNVREKLESIDIPSDLVTAQVRPALAELREEVTSLTATIKLQTNASRATADGFSRTASALTESTNTLGSAIANTKVLLAQQSEELAHFRDSREILEKVSGALAGLERHSLQLEAGFNRLSELSRSNELQEIIGMSLKTLDTLAAHVEKLGQSMLSLQQTTGTLAGINEQLRALDEHLRTIATSAGSLENSLGKQLSEVRESEKQLNQKAEGLGSKMDSLSEKSLASQTALREQLRELSSTSHQSLEVLTKISTALDQAVVHKPDFFSRVFRR